MIISIIRLIYLSFLQLRPYFQGCLAGPTVTVTGRTGYGVPDRVASAAAIYSTSTICLISWRKVYYENAEISYKVMRQDMFTTAELKQVCNQTNIEANIPFPCHKLTNFRSLQMFIMHTLDRPSMFRHSNCRRACEITMIKARFLEKDLSAGCRYNYELQELAYCS